MMKPFLMNVKESDIVLYYKIGCPAMEAFVLNISDKDRLSLKVYQGGAVPYYRANGVNRTSVTFLRHFSKGDYSWVEQQ